MTDAGFFKGTNTDQDSRFADKKKKLLKSMKFGNNLNEKVDTLKVNVKSIKPWIVKRITELLSYEDDIVCDFVVNMLSEQFPDPKDIQINLTAFLGSKSARIFVTELWDLLISAMNTAGGVPAILLEAKKAEILNSRQTLEEKFRTEQSSRQIEGAPSTRPKEHGDGPFPDHSNSPTVDISSHRSPLSSPSDDRKEGRHRRRYSSSSNSERERSRSRRRFKEKEDSKVDAMEMSGWGRRRRHQGNYSRSPSNRRSDYYRSRHQRRGHYSPRDRRFEEMDVETNLHGYRDRGRNRPQSREPRRRLEGRDEDREREGAAHNSDGPICVPRAVTPSPPPSQRRESLSVPDADINGGRSDNPKKEENVERTHHSVKQSPAATPPDDSIRRSDEIYREERRSYKNRSSWRPQDSYESRRSGHFTVENETYVEERRRHGIHEEEAKNDGKSRQRRRERHGNEMVEEEPRRYQRISPVSSFRRQSPEGPTFPPPPPVRDEKRERTRTRRERGDAPLVSPEGPELPARITNQGVDDMKEKKTKKKSSNRRDSSSSSSTSSSSSSNPSSDEEESSDSNSSDSDTSSTESNSDSSSSSENSDAPVSKVHLKKLTAHKKKKDKEVIKKKRMSKHRKTKASKMKKKKEKKKRMKIVKENVRKDKKEPRVLPPEGPELPPLVGHESPGVEWKERKREDDVADAASVSSSSSSSSDSSTESSSYSSSSMSSSYGGKPKKIRNRKSGLKRSHSNGDDDAVDVDKERGHKRRHDDDVIESRSITKRRIHPEDTEEMKTSNREGKSVDPELVGGRGGSGRRNEEDRLRRKALESLKRKSTSADAH